METYKPSVTTTLIVFSGIAVAWSLTIAAFIVSLMANYEKDLDAIFRALADPTRRAIIGQLVHGTASVKQLAEPHDMALPSFMKHISVLESSELITTRKKGRVRHCEIRPDTCETAEVWLKDVRKFWEERLEALTDFLDSE